MTTTLTVPRRTRSKLAPTLFAGVAAATLATGALSTVAEAEDARIDEVIFDVTPTPFAAIVKVWSNASGGSMLVKSSFMRSGKNSSMPKRSTVPGARSAGSSSACHRQVSPGPRPGVWGVRTPGASQRPFPLP